MKKPTLFGYCLLAFCSPAMASGDLLIVYASLVWLMAQLIVAVLVLKLSISSKRLIPAVIFIVFLLSDWLVIVDSRGSIYTTFCAGILVSVGVYFVLQKFFDNKCR